MAVNTNVSTIAAILFLLGLIYSSFVQYPAFSLFLSDRLITLFALIGCAAIAVCGILLATARARQLSQIIRYLRRRRTKPANPKYFFRLNLTTCIIFALIIFGSISLSDIIANIIIENMGSPGNVNSFMTQSEPNTALITASIVCTILPLLVAFAYLIWWRKHKKQIMLAFYGTEFPAKKSAPLYNNGQIADKLDCYRTEWRTYLSNAAQWYKYKNGHVVESGKPIVMLFLLTTGYRIFVKVLAFILVCVITVFTMNQLSNIFRLKFVEQVRIGDGTETVQELFEEAYDLNGDSEESSSEYIWKYYDSKYKALLEENASFNPDDIQDWDDFENAFEDAAKLEYKLQNQSYGYIEIRFSLDEYDRKYVSGIFFEPARTEKNKYDKKTPAQTDIVSAEILQDSQTAMVLYAVTYTDGSYRNEIATAYLDSNQSWETIGETAAVTWYDSYGNDFSISATVVSEYDFSWIEE